MTGTIHSRVREGSAKHRILKAIARRPKRGFTSDELEKRLNLSHQTVSARLSELADSSDVVRIHRTRTTRNGAQAGIYLPSAA